MFIKYNAKNIYRVGNVRLVPQMNDVDDSKWDAIKDHPHVQNKIQNGVIAVVSEKKKKESSADSSENNSLSSLSTKDAKKFVSDTLDIVTLEKWKEIETRKSVLKVIDTQIEILMTQDDEDKDEE